MICIACSEPASGLCDRCQGSLVRAPRRLVSREGVVVDVRPAFAHRGAALRLVHHLKYRRSMAAARFLADQMARQIPPGATALVPVPRVFARRAVHGVDQTRVLSSLIAEQSGMPVARGLGAVLWWPRSAGRDRSARVPQSFRLRLAIDGYPVLVDDVCTTGSTLGRAARALGYAHIPAIVATAAGSMQVRTDDFRIGEVA